MDRILRYLPCIMAAMLFALAASAGLAAPDQPAGAGAELAPPTLALPTGETPAAEAPAEMPPSEMASPLKTIDPNQERSEQLEQLARQVDRQTRHGFDLAGRGAYLAARSEFFAALKMCADGLDTERKTNGHGRALTAALTAMREAEDFLSGDSRSVSDADLARIVATHTTPVLKGETANLTSLTALKSYFTYAQEQFAEATGHEVAGSMALYGLGKLHDTLAQKKSDRVAAVETKAMVFYQAALLAYPNNFMAANDLGVLLARCGNPDNARAMLEHSLSLSQQSTTWHNLAVVYKQLGQPAMAQHADQQAAIIQRAEMVRRKMALGTTNNTVVWVDSEAFSQPSNNTPNTPDTTRPAQQQPTPAVQPGRTASPVQAAGVPRAPTSAERLSWGSRTSNR